MKVIIVLALALLGVFAHSALGYDLDWENFKLEYNKDFSDNEDTEVLRHEIFKDNLDDINVHNGRWAADYESYEIN